MGCSASKANDTFQNSTTSLAHDIESTGGDVYRQVDKHARLDDKPNSKDDKHAKPDGKPNTRVDKNAKPDGDPNTQADKNAKPDVNRNTQVDKNAKPDSNPYSKVDKHARQAPNSVKSSIADLVNYLSTPSKEPKMLVRAFFVWISENIKYDSDGLYGRSEMLPCDALSVIQNGQTVCEGYANVMLDLCRQANMNAKKIHGYAKGVGHSEEDLITTNEETNHAWNAVELDDKWYLIDGTWGTGHNSDQNQFEKCFREIYFLADPEFFINTHFPYMDDDMESSMKWQLLKRPISLEEFSRTMRRWPESYAFDVQPISHKQGCIEVNGKFEMTFKISGKLDLELMHDLQRFEGNMLHDILNTTFGQRDGDIYTVQISPPKRGKYYFNLYAKHLGDEGNFNPLFKYLLKCNIQTETKLRYPLAYTASQAYRCILHEPLKNNLPPNSQVKVCLSSPFLSRVMIDHHYFKKDGNKFEGTVKSGSSGTVLSVFASRNEDDDSLSFECLYDFEIK